MEGVEVAGQRYMLGGLIRGPTQVAKARLTAAIRRIFCGLLMLWLYSVLITWYEAADEPRRLSFLCLARYYVYVPYCADARRDVRRELGCRPNGRES